MIWGEQLRVALTVPALTSPNRGAIRGAPRRSGVLPDHLRKWRNWQRRAPGDRHAANNPHGGLGLSTAPVHHGVALGPPPGRPMAVVCRLSPYLEAPGVSAGAGRLPHGDRSGGSRS